MKRQWRIVRAAALSLLLLLGSASCLKVEPNALDSTTPFGFLLALLLSAPSGLYVAGGDQCSIWTSVGGKDWALVPNALPGCAGGGAVNALAYGNGYFLAAGASTLAAGCGLWTSPDGSSWKQHTCGSGDVLPLFSAHYSTALGKFYAGGGKPGANCAHHSGKPTDSTWTQGLAGCSGGGGNMISLVELGGTIYGSDSVGGGNAPFAVTGSTSATFPTGMTGGSWRLTFGGSNRMIAFGAAGGAAIQTSNDSGVGWNGSPLVKSGMVQFTAGVAVPATNTFIGIGDVTPCTLGLSTDNGASFQSSTAVAGCSGTLLQAIVYNEKASRFVLGGKDASNTLFGTSTTGAHDSWTFARPLDTAWAVRSIAVKP